MKKMNLLKAIALGSAMLCSSAMFAQTVIPGVEDGVAGIGTLNYVSTATQATTQVTVGTTIPLFALPDSYWSPAYNVLEGTGIVAGQTWTWSQAVATPNYTLGSAAGNYVELTGVTAGGPYTINVVEGNALCTDATPQTIVVNVLAEPTVALSENGTGASPWNVCAGDATLPTAITATIANNTATNFRLWWDLEIYTMDGDPQVADEWFDTDKSTSLGAAQAFAELYDDAAPQAVAAAGAVNITSVAGATLYEVIGNKSTVYVYSVRGINDVVSRRGDFLGIADEASPAPQTIANAVNTTTPDMFTYYDTTVETITIKVNPVPVTGPIYHINNTWAN
jgi:hypothetical protein